MWKTYSGNPVERQHSVRRTLKPGALAAFLTVLTLVQLLWWHAVLFPHSQPISSFRSSSPVESPEQADQLLRAVEPLLMELYHHFREACGFSAPNVHIYEQLLLLRHGENHTVLMNPVVIPAPNTKVSQVSESSYMCDDVMETKQKERYNSVVCSYFDRNWKKQRKVFSGREAVCLQHFAEIFNGTWPCNHNHTYHIPRHLKVEL